MSGSEPLSQPRLNGAERLVPVGAMISCPIEVKGRTVGAVAVAFDSSLTLPPQWAVDSVMREAEAFEKYLRQSPAPGKPAAGTPATASTGVSSNDVTRTQPGPFAAANGADPTRTVPGPDPATPVPPPAPAAIASPALPTLRNEVGQRVPDVPASNSARILQLLATVEAHERFDAAAAAFATELALLFGC